MIKEHIRGEENQVGNFWEVKSNIFQQIGKR